MKSFGRSPLGYSLLTARQWDEKWRLLRKGLLLELHPRRNVSGKRLQCVCCRFPRIIMQIQFNRKTQMQQGKKAACSHVSLRVGSSRVPLQLGRQVLAVNCQNIPPLSGMLPAASTTTTITALKPKPFPDSLHHP